MSKNIIPKRIYLDTKDWITLARVENGLETDYGLIEVLQKIKKLSESGEVVFPISFSHLEDIMIRKDDESRNKLIDFIMSISKGYVLQPYTFHMQEEVVNAACHRLGYPSVYDIKSKILYKGLPFILSTGYEITAKNVPEELIKKMKEEAEKPETMSKFLKDGEFSEYFRKDRKIIDGAAQNMEKNRKEKMKIDKEKRFNEAIAHYIYDIICPHLAKFLIGATKEQKDQIIPKDKKSMEKFLEDMPATNVSFRLTYGRDEWYEREVQPNDIADINHLAGAIPYCDIVVTEKTFGSLSQQLGLDKKYGCIVLRSLKELNKII